MTVEQPTEEILQPWDQQPNESKVHFIWFEYYLKLHSANRSKLAAYQKFRVDKWKKAGGNGKKPSPQSIPGQWDLVFVKHRWEERADAFDRYEKQKRLRDDEREWQARRQKVRDNEWRFSELLLDRAQQMLDFPLITQSVQEDGRTIVIHPTKWTMRDAAAMVKLASELQRSAAGMKVPELAAIEALNQAGWIPDEVLDAAKVSVEDLKNVIKSAIAGIPQLKSAEVEVKDGRDS